MTVPDYEWGEAKWGTFFWGGYAAPVAGEQGYVPNAKPDTVFLSKSPGGAMASQREIDLTNQGTYGEETSSGRTAITCPRCLEVQVVMDTTGAPDGGMLVDHSGVAGGAQTYALSVSNIGAPTAIFYQDDGQLGSLAIPTSGTADRVMLLWATEPNILTTGAGDAVRSEVWIYNYSSGVFAHTVFTHAMPTTDSGFTFTVGANNGGASAFSGSIERVRISEQFHDNEEYFQDWLGTTVAPTLTGETRLEGLLPTVASGFGDDGQFMHVHAPAAAAVRKNDLRLASPLVNEVYLDADEWVQDFAPDEWAKYPPGVTPAERGAQPFKFMLPYLRWCPVADCYNSVQVRVQVQNYTDGGTIRKLDIRCYVMSRRPVIGGLLNPGDPPPSLEYYWVDANTSTDHTSSGTGEYLDLGISKLTKDRDHGGVWLCLAAEIYSGTADTDARYKIKAWSVEPVPVDPADGTGTPDDFTIGTP